MNPSILNDPNQALWYVDAVADGGRASVELRPRLRPALDFTTRLATFYAGAHPMARLARAGGAAVVYDPFRGTAMELIETALASRAAGGGASGGGGLTLVGTDVDAAAIAVAEANLAKADLGVAHAFGVRDFRDALAADAPLPLAAGSVDAMITNPPLGRRVKVANLHALFADLFRLSADPPPRRRPPRRDQPAAGGAARRGDAAAAPAREPAVDLGLRRACSVEVWERTGKSSAVHSPKPPTHHYQGTQRRLHWVWLFSACPDCCWPTPIVLHLDDGRMCSRTPLPAGFHAPPMSTRHRVMTLRAHTHTRVAIPHRLLRAAPPGLPSRRTTQMLSLVVNSLSLNLGAARRRAWRALARSR